MDQLARRLALISLETLAGLTKRLQGAAEKLDVGFEAYFGISATR